MKSRLMIVLLLISGCSSEYSSNEESAIEIKKDITYFWCETSYSRQFTIPKKLIFVIKLNKSKLFKDGILMPHTSYCSSENSSTIMTLTGYEIAYEQKEDKINKEIERMDSSLFSPDKSGSIISECQPDDGFDYRVSDPEFYIDFFKKEEFRNRTYVLNRETLQLQISSLKQELIRPSQCKVTSESEYLEFKSDFLAKEPILERKYLEKEKREKEERIEGYKI